MARIGHASAAAALRYQHVIDGQDAEIVRFLERFGREPSASCRTPPWGQDQEIEAQGRNRRSAGSGPLP